MRKIYTICLFLFFLLFSTFAFSQQAHNQLERRIVEKALDNIEMYKSCVTISDEETRGYFLDLFVDNSVPVYNDLLGITGKKDISVSEYLKEQKNNLVSPIIKICNLNKDRIWNENGKWKVQFSFDKSLSYQNPCGIHFNTQSFYGKMYRETMVLVYDDDKEECRIESISGKIDSKNHLPEDYCFLDSTDVMDNRLIYIHRDGQREKVKYNSFGQMLLLSGYEKDQFLFPDQDVTFKCNYKPECHLMTISYKQHHWRITPHYDIGVGKALSIGNESFYKSIDSKTSSFGIDAGYIFPSKGMIKFGLFLGAGISNYSLDLLYGNNLYSFSTDQDIDGDTYNRYYTDLEISQTTKIKEYSFPLYADIDFRFSQWVSLYLDLGLSLNINSSREISDFDAKASNVYGIYPQYDDMLLDYHWGYNGFVNNIELKKDNLCGSERITINSFSPDFLIGAGLRVNIPSTPIALNLGIGYQKGLNDMITVSANNNAGNYNGNIIYNEYANSNSTEHVHDLLENSKKVSRNSWKLKIGLQFKL